MWGQALITGSEPQDLFVLGIKAPWDTLAVLACLIWQVTHPSARVSFFCIAEILWTVWSFSWAPSAVSNTGDPDLSNLLSIYITQELSSSSEQKPRHRVPEKSGSLLDLFPTPLLSLWPLGWLSAFLKDPSPQLTFRPLSYVSSWQGTFLCPFPRATVPKRTEQ